MINAPKAWDIDEECVSSSLSLLAHARPRAR